MSDPASRYSEVVSLRLSPPQRDLLAERAHTCGKTLSSYIRLMALGGIPRARPNRLERMAVYHLGKIGGNLNQLARVANATGRLEESARLREVLDEIAAAVRRLT